MVVGLGATAIAASTIARTRSNARRRRLSSSGNRIYGFDDFIFYLVKRNRFTINFFETIDNHMKAEEEQLMIDICKQIDDLSEEYLDEEKVIADLVLELEQEGIFLTTSIKGEKHRHPVIEEGRLGFLNKSKYLFGTKEFYIGFNGVKITPEILLTPEGEKSSYEKEYGEWLSLNSKTESRIEEIKPIIERLKKQLKWALFNRGKIDDELLLYEAELEELEGRIADGKYKEHNVQVFTSLTPKQKTLIMRYLKQVAICEEISSKISGLIKEGIDVYNKLKRKDLFDTAFQKARQAGDITEEDMSKLQELFLADELPKDDHGFDHFHCQTNYSLATIYYEKYIVPALDKEAQSDENGMEDQPQKKIK